MSILDEQRPIVPEWRRCVGAEQREVGTAELMLLADIRSLEITLVRVREALRAAEQRELVALAERDEAIAEIERLHWGFDE